MQDELLRISQLDHEEGWPPPADSLAGATRENFIERY